MKFSEKYDRPWFGLVTAFILPWIGYVLSYYVKSYPASFVNHWYIFLNDSAEQTNIFTFSMIPSLLLFYFILFQWKMEHASKTFVGISLIYVTIFVYLNFLG